MRTVPYKARPDESFSHEHEHIKKTQVAVT